VNRRRATTLSGDEKNMFVAAAFAH